MRRKIDLPPSGSLEERAFLHFLALDRPEAKTLTQIVQYLDSQMEAVSRSSFREAEEKLPDYLWTALLQGGTRDRLNEYLITRLGEWDFWTRRLEKYLELTRRTGEDAPGDRFGPFLAELVDWFPERANTEFEWDSRHPLILAALARAVPADHPAKAKWSTWVRRWLSARFKAGKPELLPQEFAQLVTDADARELLISLPPGLAPIQVLGGAAPDLFRRMRDCEPAMMAERVAELWTPHQLDETKSWTKHSLSDWTLSQLVGNGHSEFLVQLALPLGFSLGLHRGRRDREGIRDDPDGRRREPPEAWMLPPLEALPVEVRAQRELWRQLSNLAEYQSEAWRREIEILGLRTSLATFASDHPNEWARALPWILRFAHTLGGVVEAVTVSLSTFVEVREAISRLANDRNSLVGDRARGILVLVEGVLDPADEVRRNLIALAARQLDDGTSAVIALAGPSSTWLGSMELEAVLRAGVAEAQRRFQSYFASQGGVEEEASTGQLVESIRTAIVDSAARLSALSRASRRRLPLLEVGYRQVPKAEEAEIGCDVGFLVTLRRGPTVLLRAAEIVQVKKPSRGRATRGAVAPAAFVDRWRVDREQLAHLLRHSSTAVYWLIDPAGEVIALPAKVLLLLGNRSDRGGPRASRSFTVDYFDVRSAGINLPQFLVDLLTGLWLGSTDGELLSFVGGENRRTSPRVVFELGVDLRGGHEGNAESEREIRKR